MITLRLPSHFPVRATEWMLACMKASWGAVLLLPFDMFNAGPTAAIFAGLRAIAPQPVWGTVAFGIGMFHLAALYVNGTRRKSPHVRGFCSGVGVLFWSMVCVGIATSNVFTTGWAVYPWFVVFSVYNVVRAMQDARLSDERSRGGVVGGGR